MEAKKTAKELVNKFFMEKELYDDLTLAKSKTCALICVDAIRGELFFDDSEYADRRYVFYEDVIEEINKL
jgi:hypothetical protein